MKLHISTKDVVLSPDVEKAIHKKLVGKIEKFLTHYDSDSVLLELVLSKGERWGFVVSCDLDIPRENIHAEEKHKELLFAITALAKEISDRLRKKKEKDLH